MKQIIRNISVVVSILLVGISCQKDDYLGYDSDYASLRFVYTANGNDSIVYSFALHPNVEEDVVEIPFQLIGLASPSNRQVGVEVVTTETTAKENTNFVIESSELLAEAITGTLKVRVKKTAELDSENLVVVLRLCGNENFAEAPIDEDVFRVVLTNQLTKPTGWPFGEYSRIKHQFVIQVTGVATDYNKWNTSDRVYYTSMLVNALYEYNKAHPGDPLKDENGLLITF
ncbi:MAG: DUF4843 domain-containing protein [Bacteroides sp.]|nr:DUF4843 domain-containing protein [Bacteroides sp.]